MKRIIVYSAIVTALLTSCKKDFLNKQPVSSLSAVNFYQTQSDFDQAVVGVYQSLEPLYNGDYGAWLGGEMRSDNTCFNYNTQLRSNVARENVEQFLDDANNGVAGNRWNNDYIIIGRANKVLSTIDLSTLTDAAKANDKGQALFLRAFAYFDLVQNFGDVPLVLIPPTTYNETQIARTAKATVYNQIITDAGAAAALLPAPATQAKGHVANGAAYTLLGHVYIVLKKWADAETALKKVTGYSLLADYSSVFDPANKNNAESIFEVQYFDNPSLGVSSNFAYEFLPIVPNPNVFAGFPSSSSNGGGGWNTPTPDLIAAYDAGDKRKAASIGFYSGPSYSSTPYVNIPYAKKYAYGAKQNGQTDNDWMVYRYAEVLLFLAEAVNEQSRPGEALAYLNQVHANVRTGLSPLIVSDQVSVRTAIMHERQIELAFENKRWTDLLRWGTAVAVMNAQFAKVKANPQAYYYPAGYSLPAAAYTINDQKLLYPIPAREIQNDPLLTQNPGY